jgi:transcription elongation factor/antiterminator RfaH
MKHWYALYTKPHKEYQVESQLQEVGAETYLPTVQRKLKRRDRRDRIVYFPCYLFARLDLEVTPRSSITWMPGIRCIVCAGEEPVIIAEQMIELIQQRLRNTEHTGYDTFKQGDMVRITSGPLRDLEAVFEQPLSAVDRVRILLDVMGRMTAVDIHHTQIKKI